MRFKTEQEAAGHKDKHQLFGMVSEYSEGYAKPWVLIFPIEAHLEARDGCPVEFRRQQAS